MIYKNTKIINMQKNKMIKQLKITKRKEFRNWLEKNSSIKKECWVEVKRGKPVNNKYLWYLDAVEEALCFGWIDSITRKINNKTLQRFSPRKKKSNWSELNKERVKRLIKLNLITKKGLKILPSFNEFIVNREIKQALIKAKVWKKFKLLPSLYQRIRLANLAFYKKHKYDSYQKMLFHTIKTTKKNQTFGNWNDYGRLLNY